MAGVPLIKLFEDVGPGLLVHPGTVIRHGGDDLAAFFVQRDTHDLALRAELGRVVEDVEPDFLQEGFISQILHVLNVSLEIEVFVPPFLLCQEHALADLLAQADIFRVAEDRLALDAVQREDIGGELREAFALVPDDGQVLLLILGRQVDVQKEVGEAADAHDRGLELVGEVVDEVLAQDLRA